MYRVNKGKIYRSAHEHGKTYVEIAEIYDVSLTTVIESVRVLETHEKQYKESEVYRELYDRGEAMYGWLHSNCSITKTYNALRRAGLYTIKDIKANKAKIFGGKIRDIGKSAQNLINATFFDYKVTVK